ncbi:MAG: peptidoglycan DD-metalloendopeptidase family protein [Clostridiales bacterium]|nr:peptidoglycan DD-metalloendopeptidase family protein [Clostridiales bacterium]
MDILQLSFSASVMIAAVVIIRALTLHRLPKRTFLALWGVVICRLLIPFSIPYRFSFYTGLELVKQLLSAQTATSVVSAPVVITGVTNIAKLPAAGEVMPSVPAATAAISPIFVAWLVGMCVCTLIFITAYLKCRREFKTSLPVQNDFTACWLREHALRRTVQIRQSDRIQAPLTYGVFRPIILLPKAIDWTDEAGLKVILSHELTHIRRFDTLLKLVLAAAVCVHWFNPFVWVMYALANRDIELACDEAVVRALGENMKSAYALTLIGLEEKKSSLAPLISGFARNAIEERITAIMKIKRTSLIGVILALVLVIGTVTVFATNAASATKENDPIDTADALNQNGKTGFVTVTGGTVTLSAVDFGTHMDISLKEGSVLLVGRESWEKGDEILFRISAGEDTKLYAGIIPAENMENSWGYSDYGSAVGKELKVSSETQEVLFTVPETGEYGIIVQHIGNGSNQDDATVSQSVEMRASEAENQTTEEVGTSVSDAPDMIAVTLEINRVFENPLTELASDEAQTGATASNTGWVWPVEGCDTITSAFGKRVHPVSGTTTESDHITISGENADGAKVYATLAGTVSETGFEAEQGNYIIITHDNGIETSYRHLKEKLVMDGDPVAAGDTIGTVGKTGTATGPCLGFCVYVDGVAVNPLEYYQ